MPKTKRGRPKKYSKQRSSIGLLEMPKVKGLKGGARNLKKATSQIKRRMPKIKGVKGGTQTLRRSVSQRVAYTKKKIGRKGGAAIMGGAAGAVLGATIGGFAGAALSEPKTRKRVGEQILKITRAARKNARQLRETAEVVSEDVKHAGGRIASTSHSMQKDVKK